MSSVSRLGACANSILEHVNLQVLRKHAATKLLNTEERYNLILRRLGVENDRLLFEPGFCESMLPAGAQEYLRSDNPMLRDIESRYRSFQHPVMDHSRWSSVLTQSNEIDLRYFRGDTYVWQYRDLNFEINYLLTTNYIKSIDSLGLLDILAEDSLFGAHTFDVGGLTVSRDLLDSVAEIYFLQRTLGISTNSRLRILDIGAGYGRLAYRLARAFPSIGEILCIDPIAVSTFLSDYYLRFRKVNDIAIVIPFDKVELLSANPIDLAINCHSFSECTLASISAWLEILDQCKVPNLMIVPDAFGDNGQTLRTTEREANRGDFLPLLQAKGWRLTNRQPKYLDPTVQKHGITPTHHYLFQRDL